MTLDFLNNPTAAAVAALIVALAWLACLTARTILRVELGDEALHSDWPDDLTEIIWDDYGRHAWPTDPMTAGPRWWMRTLLSSVVGEPAASYAGRHRQAAQS